MLGSMFISMPHHPKCDGPLRSPAFVLDALDGHAPFERTERFGPGIDPAEAHKRFFEDFECPKPVDIADAIAFAIAAPHYVNIGMIEIMPTLQVPGGLRTGTRSEFPSTRDV